MGELTHGMNVEQVDELGRFLKQKGSDLGQLALTIDSRIRQSSWTGGDADRFRHDWWPAHRGMLDRIANEIDGLGQSALNNAAEQRRVSGAGGEGSGAADRATTGRAPRAGGAAPLDDDVTGIIKQLATVESVMNLRDVDLARIVELRKAGKLTDVSLKGAGLGAVIGAIDYLVQADRHGWTSHQAIWAAVDNGAGTIAGVIVPGGGVAWWVGTEIGTKAGNAGLWLEDQVGKHVHQSDLSLRDSNWLMRTYGVRRLDQVDESIRPRVASEMVNNRIGFQGVKAMVIDDGIGHAWWTVSNPARAWRAFTKGR